VPDACTCRSFHHDRAALLLACHGNKVIEMSHRTLRISAPQQEQNHAKHVIVEGVKAMTTLLYILSGWMALNVAFVVWRLSVAPRAPRND